MTISSILSAFRSEKELVQQVFARWQMDFTQLSPRSEVPFELAYLIAEQSTLRFRLLYAGHPLWVTYGQQPVSELYEELTAAEMLVRFGIDAIQETLDRGVTKVSDKILGSSIQVINAFEVSDIGVVARLRTEQRVSLVHKKVQSAGSGSWWKVVDRPDYYVAQRGTHKLESQQQQGIVQYLLQPLTGREKPLPGEILFW